MVELHGEKPTLDYMIKFDEIINDKIINDKPSIIIPYDEWIEITGDEYNQILNLSKTNIPYDTNSSTHIFEELHEINGNKYRILSAMDDNPEDPNYHPLIEKLKK